MLRRKLLLSLAIVTLLVAAAGTAWYFLSRDSLETAAMRIQLGMTKAEVQRLLEPFQQEDTMNADPQRSLALREMKIRRYDTQDYVGWDLVDIERRSTSFGTCSVIFDHQGRVYSIGYQSLPTTWERFRDWLHNNLRL